MRQGLKLYDNTRLSAFRKCPRFFYYRHVRDWEPVSTRIPLDFGGAWHAAMEVIWALIPKGVPQRQIIEAAYAAFVTDWVERGQPEPKLISYELEKQMSPRTPAVALEMISEYVGTRYARIRDVEIVSIEEPFVVPLDPEDDSLFFIGKLDKVVRERMGKGKIRGVEHKTTTAYKKDGKFKTSFIDSFSPNSQVDGYIYALHMTYGTPNVAGVWVDAALVHKTETGFMFIPVEKRLEQTNMWLWSARYWIDMIEANTAHLATLSPDDPFMAAFPQRTESCWDFNAPCEHLMTCKSWANPIGKDCPPGFRVKKWDPLEFVDAEPLLPKE